MAKADFVTSLFLIILGLGVAAESWRMPRFTEFGSSIWSAPGVVPGMIGVALALMGAALCWRARRALALPPDGSGPSGDRAAWARVAIAFALCVLFAGIMVGRIPFVLAAFGFVLAFVLIFDLQANPDVFRSRNRLMGRVGLALAIAAAASVAIATVFEDVFFVRLP